MKTMQLRRYTLDPDTVEQFVMWWSEQVAPLRRAAGFDIEFACLDIRAGEFVWAVSVPGSQTDFEIVEARYLNSPERARVFTPGHPPAKSTQVSLVTPVDFATAGRTGEGK